MSGTRRLDGQPDQCGFCKYGSAEVCGPLRVTKVGMRTVAAHQKCMEYSAALVRYKFDHFGGFKVHKVEEELKRGNKLRCSACREHGATAGCAIAKCKKTFHFPCAAVTKKMIYNDRILYRVFCSDRHSVEYLQVLDKEFELPSSDEDGENQVPVNHKDADTPLEDHSDRSDDEDSAMFSESDNDSDSIDIEDSSSDDDTEETHSDDSNTKEKATPKAKQLRKNMKSLASNDRHVRRGRPCKVRGRPSSARGGLIKSRGRPASSRRSLLHVRGKLNGVRGRPRAANQVSDPIKLSPGKKKFGNDELSFSKKMDLESSFDDSGSDFQPVDQWPKDFVQKSPGSGKKIENVVAKLKDAQNSPIDGKRKVKEENIKPEVEEKKQRLSFQNIDGTAFDTRSQHQNDVQNQPSTSNDDIIHQKREEYNGGDHDSDKVVLLIPSVLKVPGQELLAIYKNLGIKPTQSIVWPSLDKRGSVEDKHMPHFMLDIVENLKRGKLDKVQTILTDMNTDNYDYLLNYFSDKNKAGKDTFSEEAFHKIADRLATVSSKLAYLTSIKFKNMKVLVIYLSHNQPEHKSIISCLKTSIFECDLQTSVKDTFAKPNRVEEECEILWRWFMSKVSTSFDTYSYPRECSRTEKKILFDEQFSSEVTKELINNLSDLQQNLSVRESNSVVVVAIDGANRDVLKYKGFVRGTISSFTDDRICNELFFIISIIETDEIDVVSGILPPHKTHLAKIYTAFNPAQECVSCIIVHISKGGQSLNHIYKQGKDVNRTKEDKKLLKSTEKVVIKHISKKESHSAMDCEQHVLDDGLAVVKADVVEEMYFHPVDVDWQKEKAALLGLKLSYQLPTVESRQVSLVKPPVDEVPIRMDGNCYFRAISHVLTGNQRWHKSVRQFIYTFIAENDDKFSALANCPSYANSSSMNSDGVWATEVEIFATASMFATDICVYSPCGHDTASNFTYKWLTYKPLQNVLPRKGLRRSRQRIYLSNIADHYMPVYNI